MGIDERKLYQISKKDYISTHPELKDISKELQDKRYEHYEKKREEWISEAKSMRSEIIKKEEEKSKSMSKSKSNNQSGTDESKQLEAMKKQQIGEIKNMIDYEIKMEETRQKNEMKLKRQQEKEMELNERKRKEQQEKEEKAR